MSELAEFAPHRASGYNDPLLLRTPSARVEFFVSPAKKMSQMIVHLAHCVS
jgi:hypothetical protein